MSMENTKGFAFALYSTEYRYSARKRSWSHSACSCRHTEHCCLVTDDLISEDCTVLDLHPNAFVSDLSGIRTNFRNRVFYVTGLYGNSEDKLRHTRSVVYSVELVLLNKHQISGGGAKLHCCLGYDCAAICRRTADSDTCDTAD